MPPWSVPWSIVDAVVEQPPDGAAELGAVGVDEGDVVEAGVAGRRRTGAGALPRVDPDVVVVVAGGEEGGVEAALAAVGRHAEPEGVAIERQRAVEVGDPEVDVADADGRVDGFGVHAGSVPAIVRAVIGVST